MDWAEQTITKRSLNLCSGLLQLLVPDPCHVHVRLEVRTPEGQAPVVQNRNRRLGHPGAAFRHPHRSHLALVSVS